jgi:hypothetical protein
MAAEVYAKRFVFPNDFLPGKALLIFRQLSCILVFEKLVALCAGKCNENIKLLRSAMKVGYARVSTHDQHVALQLDALRKAGCRQVYEEVISGARAGAAGLATGVGTSPWATSDDLET